MGKGYLQINIYADNMAQPVEGADIYITGDDNVKINTKTNVSGKVVTIDLPCPDLKYSMLPQTLVRPYGEYDLKVYKAGLQAAEIAGIQILDGETSIQNVSLFSEQTVKNQSLSKINIPEHALWVDYGPKIIINPKTMRTPQMPGDVFVVPLVPEFIIVHDGLPTNSSAPNYHVPFTDYIKNVASSEIYSTWNYEAIKANIYAIISFTMNRIFTEWYPSQGYNFTMTSATQFDQKFIYGRDIFLTISNVVDEVFNEYITKAGVPQPYFAQYCDGKNVNNPGWLSQWGSEELAQNGKSAVSILKHYYGDEIYIDTAEVVEGIPNSFPGYNLTVGICSEAVQKLQNMLNVVASSYPAIPKIKVTDGKYKEDTKKAVTEFQKIFYLPANGVVDLTTWYKISRIFVAVSKMLEGRYNL